jgi:hypothetical protein
MTVVLEFAQSYNNDYKMKNYTYLLVELENVTNAPPAGPTFTSTYLEPPLACIE